MTSSHSSLELQSLRTGVSASVLVSLVKAVSWHPRVERVVVYGSRGRGKPKYWSDIDVAVYAPDLTDVDRFALDAAIEDAPVVYPVDVTYYDSRYTTDALRRAIDRDGVVIYDRASDPSPVTIR